MLASGARQTLAGREKELRRSFKRAVAATGLKPIPMYNARHSFGTALARLGIPLRTIQALMRHERQETTQQYMAYSPQDDLGEEVPAKWAREMRRICEEMGVNAALTAA